MLRDVVIHLHNEQPLLADLLFEPAQTDNVVICRNLRTTNKQKPLFVDRSDSTFVIPMAHVRFIEVTQTSIEAHQAEEPSSAATAGPATAPATAFQDRLAWIGGGAAGEPPPTPAGAPDEQPAPDGKSLDENLLRRIKDV